MPRPRPVRSLYLACSPHKRRCSSPDTCGSKGFYSIYKDISSTAQETFGKKLVEKATQNKGTTKETYILIEKSVENYMRHFPNFLNNFIYFHIILTKSVFPDTYIMFVFKSNEKVCKTLGKPAKSPTALSLSIR